jgi:prolyl-tRNA synthetase
MKVSQLFTKTKKEAPADEVSKNAQLLIRAGYIHKEMAGAYTFLPLGLKVLENINQVIREEMNAIGGQEMRLTALQDAEIWKATDRWDDEKVDVWFKTKLKNDTELGLAPTHEEPLVRAVKPYVNSYKDLPFLAYQIQTKFRNETRAKSGVMRGREFLMKDLYSFARSQEEHDELYEKIGAAYEKTFQRLGIGDKTFKTFASGGMFSKYSHEFQTVIEAGEDEIYFDEVDNQYLNREIVAALAGKKNEKEEPKELEEHELKGVIGAEALVKAFNIPLEKSTKALFFVTDKDELIMAVVRSDYNVDTDKLSEVLGVTSVVAATPERILKETGAEVGYAGLVNLKAGIKTVLDDSLDGLCNFETGTNKTGFHAVNVNFGRDVETPKEFVDIKVPNRGDINPKNNQPYPVYSAAEVGNIFTLRDRFSKPLGLTFVDENGQDQNVLMGCYGIGPSRLVGVITELLGDEKGLVWPVNIAPYKVYLASVGQDEAVVKAANDLYGDLQASGITVLYDDRDVRPGEKFADADLLGMPYRVVVSNKTLEQGKIEVKKRTASDNELITTEEFKKVLQDSAA